MHRAPSPFGRDRERVMAVIRRIEGIAQRSGGIAW